MIRLTSIFLIASGMLIGAAHSQTTSSTEPWPHGVDPAKVIDIFIEQGWQQHKVQPALLCDDAAFARRVHLDLIGRIPNREEQDRFVQNSDSRKRGRLVDALLQSPEHPRHMAELFDAIFLGRTEVRGLQRRAEAGWTNYLEDVFARNRPWNEVVEELLLARPKSKESRGAAWYLVSRNDKHQEMAEAVSKDLFGVRIDCAQCHNHPLADEIGQRHYWGLVAFFNRSKNCDTPWGQGLNESAIGGFSEFANIEGQSQPNELVYLGDFKVDETRPAKDVKENDIDDLYFPSVDGQPRIPKFSRRQKFVEEIARNNPLIAQALVNRIWGWMLGRGIVHPVDTLDSYHPASHPELLNWLSRDFADSGYDVRRLIRSIASSQTYQLASARSEFIDPQWFAHGLTKPLTAEMLHRSWMVVFQPDDPGRWEDLAVRVEIMKNFPDVMADEPQSTVSQGLLLTNGGLINQLTEEQHSKFIKRLCQQTENTQCVDEMFAQCMGRLPDAEEREQCLRLLETAATKRQQVIRSLVWALVTSAEFRFNH